MVKAFSTVFLPEMQDFYVEYFKIVLFYDIKAFNIIVVNISK